MPIERMAKDAALGDDTAKLLATVYDEVVSRLVLQRRIKVSPELIAAKIIRIAKCTQLGGVNLRDIVMRELPCAAMLALNSVIELDSYTTLAL